MKKHTDEKKNRLAIKSDKTVISREKKTTRILEIIVTTPEKDQSNIRAPLNISLVLDRSGSMNGEKLHYVKQAAIHVLDLLDEKDTASVVVYDDEIETIVPSGNLTEIFRRQAIIKVQKIQSGGSTCLSGGWLKGCEQVASRANGHTINRTLLLTDGLANVGIQDAEELATHARELFRRGVSTSCFGVGLGYDEHLLEGMANNGGGNFHFLETTNAIPLVFEREFNELVDISLRDVELVIKLPQKVTAYVAAGWPNEFKDDRMALTLGSLYAGRAQRIYVTLIIEPGTPDVEIVFPITLRGKDKNDYIVELTNDIRFTAVSSSEEEKSAIDQSLMERYTEVHMADMANEALKKERSGDRAGANYLMHSSIQENQAHMPAPMRSKFEFMADEMSVGMSDETRKRHHREEYENKRGQVKKRDYVLRMVNGHLFTEIEGQSIMIDSGIPISLGKTSEIYFLNTIHPLLSDYMGVSIDRFEKMVGSRIDVLMGMDILKNYSITLALAQHRLLISSGLSLSSRERIPMTSFMGVPIINIAIDGKVHEVFIDTGTKLSYIKEEIALQYPSIGKERDFYPGIGEFETKVYEIPFQLGIQKFNLKCGVLPAALEATVFVTGKSGIIGSELFEKFMVSLAFPENSLLIG
ncbi:MAG: VWA domain-containing protein [Anaerolineaceae bacterium]